MKWKVNLDKFLNVFKIKHFSYGIMHTNSPPHFVLDVTAENEKLPVASSCSYMFSILPIR